MRLKSFRILDYRTIADSGWIDVSDVTSLVGENEAGKTNVLLPLWKLNPSGDGGEIDLLADFPRDRYHSVKALPPDKLPVFIEADFILDPELVDQLARMTGETQADMSHGRVHRKYNGEYIVSFPRAKNDASNQSAEAKDAVLKALPHFLYYSTYGNLDSEIFLPTVIQNMQRIANKEKLGAKETAKARTLKVLFEFVQLSPQEVLELGKEPPQNPPQNEQQLAEYTRRKKERQVLLNSASTDLTIKFKDWWKQGNVQFLFQADGDYFRISVTDDLRPAPVDLESRSSGLQWFFSFFLVFLVERRDEHKNTVLLLDEPGVSLHPIAQRDLTKFFENLAKENQLLYTSHSPFLINYDRLDEVKVVYIGDDGITRVSDDLRASEKDPRRTRSIFAVFAALGLSSSETLLLGAAPVIVEGTTDQWYLSFVKTHLIREGAIRPARELLFIPAGGASGVKTVASILTVSDVLPPTILDSDEMGRNAYDALKSGLYNGSAERLTQVASITGIDKSEVEDLMPGKVLSMVATRLYRAKTEDFSNVYDHKKPITPQIEAFAQKHAITLPEAWKIELAKNAVQRMRTKPDEIDAKTVERWKKLFEILVQQTDDRTAILDSVE